MDILEHQVQWALYRLRDTDGVRIAIDQDININSRQGDASFVYAPFDASTPAKKFSFVYDYEPSMVPSWRVSEKKITADYRAYSSAFDRCLHAIQDQSSALEKVVLAHRLSVDCTVAPQDLFWRALAHFSKETTLCLYRDGEDYWLTATPETLCSVKEGVMQTMALAGTLHPQMDRSWSNKEREEQQIVERAIVDQIKEHSSSSVEITPTETVHAGTLRHLRSEVSVASSESAEYWAQILHPTPAVCGFPTDVAQDTIRAVEPDRRSFYSGWFGELNSSGGACYVNLRCMRWSKQRADIFVGGGLVEGSVKEQEWEETLQKASTLTQLW